MDRPTDVVGTEEPDASVFWRWVWDSVRPVLGYVLVAIGLIALLIGWYGVSGESIVAKQLPYIASGGLLGVALVALGGRFMLIQDLRRDSNRLDRLETMVNELHAALLARPDAPGRELYIRSAGIGYERAEQLRRAPRRSKLPRRGLPDARGQRTEPAGSSPKQRPSVG